MTTQLAPVGVQRFYDNLNLPAIGGKVYTYAAGTTTPQSTYTDSTGVTANTNPIILNTRGEAAIWLTPSLFYKFVVFDAAGNALQTVDGVSSDNGLLATVNGLAGSLAGANGSAGIGTTQNGVGAITRTLKAKVDDWFTPADFGDITASPATATVQSTIDQAKALGKIVQLFAGPIAVGPLSGNGTGSATPVDSQWSSVGGIRGEGRFSSVFQAYGSYASTDYVLTARNTAQTIWSDFGVDGASIAKCGIDLSWVGGSGGNASAAPSNQIVVRDLFVQGCTDVGINLDNVHDSVVSGISVRGVSATGTGFSMQMGDGGTMTATDIWIASGLTKFSCQEGGITNFGLNGGLQLTGAGLNHVSLRNGQIQVDPSNGTAIKSTAIGNATQSISLDAVFFDDMTYCVAGRWRAGGIFTNCRFGNWTAFIDLANFEAAGGAGNVPVFIFIGGKFNGSLPATVQGKYKVILIGVEDSSGNIVSSSDATFFATAWTAAGTAPAIGNGTNVGYVVRNGDAVTHEATITMGSTTTYGSGAYSFSVLYGLKPGPAVLGRAAISHGGTTVFADVVGATPTTIRLIAASGSSVAQGTPVTLVAGDVIAMVISYITSDD